MADDEYLPLLLRDTAVSAREIDELEVETHRRKKMVGNPKRQAVKRESMRVVRSTRVFNDHLLA